MKVLVWQWSRFGGPPAVAAALARGLAELSGVGVALSLARAAEILQTPVAPRCDLPVDTYRGHLGFVWRLATAPLTAGGLARRIAKLRPDLAVCAQPGPLDLLMALALRRLRVPFVVLVHDAEHHPGDGQPLQMQLQRALCRRAAAIGALSSHVGEQLIAQGLITAQRPLLRLDFPPLPVALPPAEARRDDMLHLLCFGRLLSYKGLDLLADALTRLGPQPNLRVRVVGSGPDSADLRRLQAMPQVAVENRWVPEGELGTLLAWADALVLPYREASQSAVAGLALAAGRRVLATRVGGLTEQLGNEPLATLCDPDAASLADALLQLVRSPRFAGSAAARDTASGWRDVGADLLRQLRPLMH